MSIIIKNEIETDILSLGTSAVIVQPRAEQSVGVQRRLWSMGRALEQWPEIEEIVFGMTNLMAVCHTQIRDPDNFTARLRKAWEIAEESVPNARIVEIPTIYGGERATDMAALCDASSLSITQIAALHSAPVYDVFAVGSVPGFAYLGGLDPRLFMPRKQTPALRVEKNSLIIGGMQTAVSTVSGPGGWNAIGQCEANMFDATKNPPCLLAPGDRVRFIVERVLDA